MINICERFIVSYYLKFFLEVYEWIDYKDSSGDSFDLELFELCRNDDYVGITKAVLRKELEKHNAGRSRQGQ